MKCKSKDLGDPINKYEELLGGYPLSTKDFIKYLQKEFRELDPELYGNLAPYKLRTAISKIIKGSKDFLKDILRKFKYPTSRTYYPNYKFSLKRLNGFKEGLKREFKEIPKGLSDLIDYYIESNINLKLTPRQQYHKYNPNLDEYYFHNINKREKAYFLGFLLADGWLGSYDKDEDTIIGFGTPTEQLDGLIHFCDALGLDKNKISKDPDSDYFKVRFGCGPMKKRLIEIGYKKFKMGENFPFASSLSTPLYKAFLLGFFDGDGIEGTSKISNTNLKFLKQLRVDFEINSQIKIEGKPQDNWKQGYYIYLGASLFNKLLNNYKKSLVKKRIFLSEIFEIYDTLKERIGNAEKLQEWINFIPRKWIAKFFRVDHRTLNKLCDEWDIKVRKSGWWSKEELRIAKVEYEKFEEENKKFDQS